LRRCSTDGLLGSELVGIATSSPAVSGLGPVVRSIRRGSSLPYLIVDVRVGLALSADWVRPSRPSIIDVFTQGDHHPG
jgi:hypothetical protein